METPRNWAGQTTERVMLGIKRSLELRRIHPLDTKTYNAIYEGVLAALVARSAFGERDEILVTKVRSLVNQLVRELDADGLELDPMEFDVERVRRHVEDLDGALVELEATADA